MMSLLTNTDPHEKLSYSYKLHGQVFFYLIQVVSSIFLK